MASNASIVINDGATTPLAHTFDPVSIKDGSVANYQNKVATIVSGRESLAAKMKSSAIVRTVNLDLKVPYIVTEVLNGINVPRVYNFGQIKATVIVPVDWSAAQCKNLRVLGSNALVNAAIGLMIDEAEFVW